MKQFPTICSWESFFEPGKQTMYFITELYRVSIPASTRIIQKRELLYAFTAPSSQF